MTPDAVSDANAPPDPDTIIRVRHAPPRAAWRAAEQQRRAALREAQQRVQRQRDVAFMAGIFLACLLLGVALAALPRIAAAFLG